MTSIEREKLEAMARQAKVIRDVWLHEREEARTEQISANAEIRRGWREADNWREIKSGFQALTARLSKTRLTS